MTIGMMASLTEFRFGPRKLLLILGGYSVWVSASSLVLLWIGGELLLLRLFYLTISVPATVLTYLAASDSPTQAVFNYMTQIMLSVLAASGIRMLTDSLGLSGLVNILLMGIFYSAVIYLEWRFLRRPFRMLIQVLPARWGVLTLIPCVFCVYLIFVSSWPGSYLENTAQRVYIYTAVIPLTFVYIAIFKSLLTQYRIQTERQSAALLTVQIAALKEKVQKVKEVEEEVRIQRHDLRHQLQAVTELVAQGGQGYGAGVPERRPKTAGRAEGQALVPSGSAGRGIFLVLRPGPKGGHSGERKDFHGRRSAGGRGRIGHRRGQCLGKRHPRLHGAARRPAGDPVQNGEYAGAHAGNFQSVHRRSRL